MSRTVLKHFFFHFLKVWVELYKKKQILTFLCLLLSRNHDPKPQKSEFLSNFGLHVFHGYHLHILFSGFCESYLRVLILWSKNRVQARAWDKNSKLLCNAAHDGGSLKSGAKCKYSIVSSNMVLSDKRN